MPQPLSLALVSASPAGVRTPSYARDALSPGIVHFGVGNFHRAHQAVYLDDLFGVGEGLDWAIVGAGVRASDEAMRERLAAQDWLTTVVERDAFGQSARVTGAMIDFVPVGDTEALLALMADPAIRIVSLTITEGGYYLDTGTGAFDAAHPDIVADAATPETPRSVFGLIVAALKLRRIAGVQPFTVMSCDNIPGNGGVTRNSVAGMARLTDPALADWIEQKVAFPNSMVDRITPATSDAERALVRDDYGIVDAVPVACETFRQWVIEDHFPAGRPPLEKVGVTFVADVEPFETMKLRILNAGHFAIAYPAGVIGVEFVDAAMKDEDLLAFFGKLETEEIIPAVPPVPGMDLSAYYEKIVERFANPTVGDTIRRLCWDGSSRFSKFILPIVRDRLGRGESVTGLALVAALWARYCAATTDDGAEIVPNDPIWDTVRDLSLKARNDPKLFLGLTEVFGELADAPEFADPFSRALAMLWAKGTRATLEAYIADSL